MLILSGINVSEVITDRLEAKSAFVHQLQVDKPIVTQRGDIAYHFPLNKSAHDGALEEGDVIGFFGEPHEKSHIEKLTHFNASRAKMAGVISRSAYLEAKTPAEDEAKGKFEDVTEKICLCKPMLDNNDQISCFLAREDN